MTTTDYQYNIKGGSCLVCGERFEGWHRYNKTTCSDSCRKTLSRYPERIDASFHRMLEIVDFYSDAMRVPEHREKIISALKTIREAIEESLDEA